VSQYQKGKTNLDFTEARDSEWQWHQLGRMQVYTSLQTDNHTSTPPLCFTGWMPFLPPNQQHQTTEGKLSNMSLMTNFFSAGQRTCTSCMQHSQTERTLNFTSFNNGFQLNGPALKPTDCEI